MPRIMSNDIQYKLEEINDLLGKKYALSHASLSDRMDEPKAMYKRESRSIIANEYANNRFL